MADDSSELRAPQADTIQVLLIEDSPTDVMLVEQMLADAVAARFTLESVDRLAAGLERLAQGNVDVVILDLGLPDSLGLETVDRVRAEAPDVPVVVQTGLDDQAVGIDAVQKGAQDYLVKGDLTSSLLERTIRHAIGRQGMQAELKKQAEELRESETRYRTFFEFSPIPLREEDHSGIKAYIDDLRSSGVEDFKSYFDEHPEAVANCARMVKVVDANRATVRLYAAESREELRERFGAAMGEESYNAFRDELLAIAAGETTFQCETVARSFADEKRDIVLRWRVAPGYEDTLSRVWVSVIDLTKRKRAEEALRDNLAQLLAAQRIQERLLPEAPPSLSGFDIAGATYPAEFAAGDYFDYVAMLNESVGFVVGDVSGHGFGPALLTASTRAYLRLFAMARSNVGTILTLANSALAQETEPEHYVTLLLARLDPDVRSLAYVNAGHPSGYVLDLSGAVKATLESKELPLAVVPDTEYPAGDSVALEPGDTVFLLTDGIVEARSPEDALFGPERALEVVRANLSKAASEIIQTLYHAVCDFSGLKKPSDDVTAVVIRVEPEMESAERGTPQTRSAERGTRSNGPET